jgi:hypothetical protein
MARVKQLGREGCEMRTLTVSLVALAGPVLVALDLGAALGSLPSEALTRHCEMQALVVAGAPPLSPRAWPELVERGRRERSRPEPVISALPEDVVLGNSRPFRDASGAQAFRAAYEACLRARGL